MLAPVSHLWPPPACGGAQLRLSPPWWAWLEEAWPRCAPLPPGRCSPPPPLRLRL